MLPVGHLKCMVIDDDASTLMTISKMLESVGSSEVTRCNSAREALDILSCGTALIDVVFTDLNMPDIDGIQLLRHFTGLGSNFGVVLISAEEPRLLESVHKLASQLNLHIIGKVSKPVTPNQLEGLLQNYKPLKLDSATSPGAMVCADEVQVALQNQQIQAFLQPQVDINSGKLVGCEILARWHHDEKGWISPTIFIGIAEKYNMISELTHQIYNQSLDHLAKAREAGFDFRVAVNFSRQVLNNLGLPEELASAIEKRGLTASDITIEVTESTVAKDMSVMLDILTRLRLKGFGLSIDDFGTGFSSLEQVNQIPFTELKIDRSFVHRACEDSASNAILESSVALTKLLKIESLAEGVEQIEDWENIKKLGCDIAQGFLVAKPMPIDALLEWAEENRNGVSF